jgi:hypothetical protein
LIVTTPLSNPLAVPALTEAIVASDEDHVADEVMSFWVPSLYVAVAESWVVLPTVTAKFWGATTIAVIVGFWVVCVELPPQPDSTEMIPTADTTNSMRFSFILNLDMRKMTPSHRIHGRVVRGES